MASKWTKSVAVCAIVLLALGTGKADENAKGKVSLPEVVRTVIEAICPGAKIQEVEAEQEGIRVIEVVVHQDGQERSVTLTEDGVVMAVESKVSDDDLPPAVAKTLKAKAAGGKIVEIEKEEIRAEVRLVKLPRPKTLYEAKIVRGDRAFEIVLTAAGGVVSVKALDNDDERDEEGDDDDDNDEVDHDKDGEHGRGGKSIDKDDDEDDDNEGDDEGDDDDDNDEIDHDKDGEHGRRGKAVDKEDDEGNDDDQGDEDEEDQVSMDRVPKAVKAAILKHANGGKIKEVDREDEDGKVVYEVDVIIKGKEIELRIASNGKLLAKQVEEGSDGDDDENDDK